MSSFCQDEKALLFFTTVPQKWRLFWAIYTVGISFALALVGIVYVGDPNITLENNENVFNFVPGWFVWAVNPGAVTLLSFFQNIVVLKFAGALSDARAKARTDEAKTWGVFAGLCKTGAKESFKSAYDFFRKSPCLCATLCVWLAHGLVSGSLLLRGLWGSTIQGCQRSGNEGGSNGADGSDDIDDNDKAVFYVALTIAILALIAGVSMKTFPSSVSNYHNPTTVTAPMDLAVMRDLPYRRTCVCLEDSYLPSLLTGWGVGYLASTLLLGSSLYKIWWSGAPLALTIIGYIVLPSCFIAVVVMIADDDFLGTKWEPLLKATSGSLGDKRGVWYWILATAVRDIIIIWVLMWGFLVPCLNNI